MHPKIKAAKERLSLADRVNIAILVLTMLGIAVAVWTLMDAKQTGEIQKAQYQEQSERSQTQFIQEMVGSQKQFQKQLSEERKSREALEQARDRLKDQSTLLEHLQKTTEAQLKRQDDQLALLRSEYKAPPLPSLNFFCLAHPELDIGKQQQKIEDQKVDIAVATPNMEPIAAGPRGDLICTAMVTNLGDDDLHIDDLIITVSGGQRDQDPLGDPAYEVQFSEVRDPCHRDQTPDLTLDRSVHVLKDCTLLSAKVKRQLDVEFIVLVGRKVSGFSIGAVLTSNVRPMDFTGYVKVTHSELVQ